MATTSTSQSLSQTIITHPTAPILTHGAVSLRPYHPSDAVQLAKNADNPLISRYMRNRFPNPYKLSDAESWIKMKEGELPCKHFAICRAADGVLAGGIGLIPKDDVEYRTWEVGYWLGEEFWGQGLATDALTGFVKWCFEEFPTLLRLEAGIFEGNAASEAVVKKSGFVFEGRRRKAVEKNGVIMDIAMYSLLREECSV
jgi:[ribosomal protein S5]-alanine N-acetyltransferase